MRHQDADRRADAPVAGQRDLQVGGGRVGGAPLGLGAATRAVRSTAVAEHAGRSRPASSSSGRATPSRTRPAAPSTGRSTSSRCSGSPVSSTRARAAGRATPTARASTPWPGAPTAGSSLAERDESPRRCGAGRTARPTRAASARRRATMVRAAQARSVGQVCGGRRAGCAAQSTARSAAQAGPAPANNEFERAASWQDRHRGGTWSVSVTSVRAALSSNTDHGGSARDRNRASRRAFRGRAGAGRASVPRKPTSARSSASRPGARGGRRSGQHLAERAVEVGRRRRADARSAPRATVRVLFRNSDAASMALSTRCSRCLVVGRRQVLAQRRERDAGAVPGAEVLRGDARAGQLAEALVEFVGADRRSVDGEQPPPALLEQVRRSTRATARSCSVTCACLPDLAGKSNSTEPPTTRTCFLVSVRQAVAGVLLGVLLAADAQSADVDDAQHRGEHLVAVEGAPAQLRRPRRRGSSAAAGRSRRAGRSSAGRGRMRQSS